VSPLARGIAFDKLFDKLFELNNVFSAVLLLTPPLPPPLLLLALLFCCNCSKSKCWNPVATTLAYASNLLRMATAGHKGTDNFLTTPSQHS